MMVLLTVKYQNLMIKHLYKGYMKSNKCLWENGNEDIAEVL